ncbi:MAG: DUF2252 family protein [Betaproteobacteria bacterium]|nr:DUF2252 family protein [Betaproteobacteria bacterium]
MKRKSVVERIAAFNRGRDPERLTLKYQAMRTNPLAFLRGTCHLFYDALPRARVLREAPAAWICGDLHVENFGTYKADNRQVYFDLNDFDEGALAPCTWDLLRLVLSALIAARCLGLRGKARRALGSSLVSAYADALTLGKARWVERETAQGLVRTLLDNVRHRDRKKFLDSRTTREHGTRKLLIDGKRTLAAARADCRRVMAFMRDFAREQADPGFFKPLDAARRVAGTGSLGIERYVVLIEGRGSPDGNLLLDLKHQPRSALQPHLKLDQPRWKSEADRVVQVQRRAQAIAPAFLRAVEMEGKAFLFKEAQPVSDKISLIGSGVKTDELQRLMVTLGHVVAWSHLRTGGRQGSAIADELIAYGSKAGWQHDLLRLADEMVPAVVEDWKAFRAADL